MVKFIGTQDDLRKEGFKYCPVSPFNTVCLMFKNCLGLYALATDDGKQGLLVNDGDFHTIIRDIRGRKDELVNEDKKIMALASQMRLTKFFEIVEDSK